MADERPSAASGFYPNAGILDAAHARADAAPYSHVHAHGHALAHQASHLPRGEWVELAAILRSTEFLDRTLVFDPRALPAAKARCLSEEQHGLARGDCAACGRRLAGVARSLSACALLFRWACFVVDLAAAWSPGEENALAAVPRPRAPRNSRPRGCCCRR